jgi:hypothetical protein
VLPPHRRCRLAATLGFVAAVTERVTLATEVLVLPQRQTALVARQAADVDLLSGGRLRLGVGVGWSHVEYEALGQDFRTRGCRQEERKIWANWASAAMAPNSTWVPSGKISASAVKWQPAGRRWISSLGCDQVPGMRRAISIGAAGSFILNFLRRSPFSLATPPYDSAQQPAHAEEALKLKEPSIAWPVYCCAGFGSLPLHAPEKRLRRDHGNPPERLEREQVPIATE